MLDVYLLFLLFPFSMLEVYLLFSSLLFSSLLFSSEAMCPKPCLYPALVKHYVSLPRLPKSLFFVVWF